MLDFKVQSDLYIYTLYLATFSLYAHLKFFVNTFCKIDEFKIFEVEMSI